MRESDVGALERPLRILRHVSLFSRDGALVAYIGDQDERRNNRTDREQNRSCDHLPRSHATLCARTAKGHIGDVNKALSLRQAPQSDQLRELASVCQKRTLVRG